MLGVDWMGNELKRESKCAVTNWLAVGILNDLEVLAKMCGCRLQKIEKIFPKIKHLFTEVKEKDGKKYLICNQAEEERKEQSKNRKKRSVAGKLGAKIRWSEESLEESKWQK